MEVSAALASMQAELICPVCLDYLSNPVTTDCGHNFCESCIQMSWKDLGVRFPCPVCRQSNEEKRVSVNAQLRRLVEMVKLLHSYRSSKETQEEERRCAEHNQVLSLFCDNDLELVCALCAQRPAHQGHHVRPVEEAAAHHRQRLSTYIESVEKQLAEVEKLSFVQDRRLLQLREEVEEHRSVLSRELEQLVQHVDREQEEALCRLAEEDRRLQHQHNVRLAASSARISALKGLIQEVAERSVMSEEMMLANVRSLEQRCQSLLSPTVQSPAEKPLRIRQTNYSLPPLYSVLNTIIQKFQEPVSLDPQTAHPDLRVSEDEKSVTYVRKRRKVSGRARPWAGTAELAVLGKEVFASGRHYWEVQVGHKPEWAVGVCTAAPCSKAQWPLVGPKRCWTVQLQDGGYLAVGSVVVPLALKDKPTGIGIYLDCELGQVSFYDARDRSHLHSFTETFDQVLKPYFRVGQDSAPLTVDTGSE